MVKSTLAAKTLALVNAAETLFCLSGILKDLFAENYELPIECKTDCTSLLNASYSRLEDLRLHFSHWRNASEEGASQDKLE